MLQLHTGLINSLNQQPIKISFGVAFPKRIDPSQESAQEMHEGLPSDLMTVVIPLMNSIPDQWLGQESNF
jgi:hypothetical protein